MSLNKLLGSCVVSAWLVVVLGGCYIGFEQREPVWNEDTNAGHRCDYGPCPVASPSHNGSGGSGLGGSGDLDASADHEEPPVPPQCDQESTLCLCADDGSCVGDRVCIDQVCVVPCVFSSECGASRVCANGRCVLECGTLNYCPEGYTCSEIHTCVDAPRDPECRAEDDDDGGDGVDVEEDMLCTDGYICANGVCAAACDTNEDCALDEVCNSRTGACEIDTQPTRPCAADPGVCGSRQICHGGYCRYSCSDSLACKLIDARIPVCADGVCLTETEANPQCVRREDCAEGENCVSNVCR